ncbi:MAG: hypothetical protein ACJ8OJ_20650 [Povalibacter sp.]
MKLRIHLLATLALLAGVQTGTVHAGTVLETTTRDLSQGTTNQTTTQVQSGKIRMESSDHDGFAVFRDDTLFVINNRDKNYVDMDRATIKRMADTLNPALKQLQERMAEMSPEQRAQIEQMMGGSLPDLKTQVPQEVRHTARKGKVQQYACEYVEVLENSVVTDELCVAPPASLEGGEELMTAATRMSQLIQEIFKDLDAPWLKQSLDRQLQNYDKLGGVPVAAKHFDSGKPVSETTLKSIRKQSVQDSQFEVPKGYSRRDMMKGK